MDPIVRKIQLVGNRSYSISLPKPWIEYNNLSEKNSLKIFHSNNKLILSPTNSFSKEEITKEILIESNNLLATKVLLFYIKGINNLKLNFNSLSDCFEGKKILLKFLRHIESFKITDESTNSITISSIHHTSKIQTKTIAKRMCVIIHQMLESIELNDIETKHILEDETDSLYYLSNRILNFCSKDLEIRNNNDILDIEEIFQWRTIFKRLENIADILEKNITCETIDFNKISQILTILKRVLILNSTITSKDLENISNFSCENYHIQIIHMMTKDILQALMTIKLNRKYFYKN